MFNKMTTNIVAKNVLGVGSNNSGSGGNNVDAGLRLEEGALSSGSGSMNGSEIKLLSLQVDSDEESIIGDDETRELKEKPVFRAKASGGHSWFGLSNPKVRRLANILVALLVMLILLYIPIESMKNIPAAQYCTAVFAFVVILWSLEPIPLYVTSLMIPLLVVWFRLLILDRCSYYHCDNCNHFQYCQSMEIDVSVSLTNSTLAGINNNICHQPICRFESISAHETANEILKQFFKPVIILFLGTFTIASALRKYSLDTRIAWWILRAAGSDPAHIILSLMFAGWFLSCWITNVAGSAVVISIATPLLGQMSDPNMANFAKCLLLGIVTACSLGGQVTPIASPQNVVALHALLQLGECSGKSCGLTFGQWMIVAAPVSLLGLLAGYYVLIYMYKPTRSLDSVTSATVTQFRMTGVHVYVLTVTGITLLLCFFIDVPFIKNIFGDIGLTGLVPIVLFYGTGVLTVDDLNHETNWSVLLLIGGGLCLGHAINSSQLLDIVTTMVATFAGSVYSPGVLFIFAAFLWVFSNFVSHTVAAVITMPVIAVVGQGLQHPQSLVILTVLMDSAAMLLPISGFPNTMAFALRDRSGVGYLTTNDFLKIGSIIGVIQLFCVCTIGYAISIWMGF